MTDTASNRLLYIGTDDSGAASGPPGLPAQIIDPQALLDSADPEEVADSILAAYDPEALLLSDTVDSAGMCAILETIGSVRPSLPVVVFATDDETIEQALDAGAAEIIYSQAETAPQELVERRISSATRASPQAAGSGELVGTARPIFEEVVESIGEVVWVRTAGERGIDYVNSAYETVWGQSPAPLYEDKTNLIETVHPEDRQQIRDAMDQQFDGSEPADVTYRIVRPDGDIRWMQARSVHLTDTEGRTRMAGIATDITEQKGNEQQLEAERDELETLAQINRLIRTVDDTLLGAQNRSEALQAVCDNLASTEPYHSSAAVELVGDSRLEVTQWTDEASTVVNTIFPVTGSVVQRGPGWQALESNQTQVVRDIDSHPAMRDDWVEVMQAADISSFAVLPVSYDDVRYGVIVVYATSGSAFNERTVAVLDELGTTVGHAIAAVERREREQTLTSLYRATEQFLAAETPQEVSDVVVETATAVLDLSGIGVFLIDDETSRLSPASGTDTLFSYLTDTEEFGPGKTDSIVWHSYITGETQCFDDVRQSERLANEGTDARSVLAIPLGEHGVFVAAADEIGLFDEQTRPLIRLLATTAEAALDRVIGQADIEERDAELAVRDEEMNRLQERFTLVRQVSGLIRRATAREQLEQDICEMLVDHDRVAFAWIGTKSPDSEAPEPSAWAGDETGYLDSNALAGGDPASQALQTGEPTTVSETTAHLHTESWARKALDRGYQSVLAMPLVYDGIPYGVIAVYLSEPDVFDDETRDIAQDIGEMVAFGINSLETRHGALGPTTTGIRVSIGETTTFFNRVAATAGRRIVYREIHSDDETTRLQFTVPNAPVDDILALESEFVTVESITRTRRDERDLFQVSVTGDTILSTVVGCGGVPQRVTTTPDETKVTIALSSETRRSEFVERLSNYYPDTELLSTEDWDQYSDSVTLLSQTLEDQLTARQREVLFKAHEHGYFESPRETTGQEIAELLDVSQPTFTHHLREAQRRIFETVLTAQVSEPSKL